MGTSRRCGVLLPVTALPSPGGIGCLSEEARRFVDFLQDAGQTYWQILPLGQTGYGDSPYQSFSTFAGNPYLIDPEALRQKGYLDSEDLETFAGGEDPGTIDYGRLYEERWVLLRKAYYNSPFCENPLPEWAGGDFQRERERFEEYIRRTSWLEDYCLFSAVKEQYGGKSWLEWDEDIRLRRPEAMARRREELSEQCRFYAFVQFLFDEQWHALRAYANGKGIRIIGDIPIYVALDSADTWSHPELFELDDRGFPTVVAGCPPDAFSDDGQLWGNPIYRWPRHRETGYAWWIERLDCCFKLYDMVRIDHFRGFDEYYAIPGTADSARTGEWRPGPGADLFRVLEERLGDQAIIAEDLGYLTPSVHALLRETGYPGMKVLQFAFDTAEDNDYLPHNYPENCVVYTGTHDNDTTRGWFDSQAEWVKQNVRDYCGSRGDEWIVDDMIRLALRSRASVAVIPMQDYLELGSEGRINTPSTLGGNWCWRLDSAACTGELAGRMRDLARIYRRLPE